MSIIDLLKLALKYLIGIYFSAALSFIVISVGTDRKNYMTDAFSPIKLISEMTAGNRILIEITIWMFVLLKIIGYLIAKKVDNLEDVGEREWLRTWWNWWNQWP